MAKIPCPKCAKTLDIPDSLAGKKVRCAGCETVFETPRPAPIETAEEVEEEVPVTIVAELPMPMPAEAPEAKKPARTKKKSARATAPAKETSRGGAGILLALGVLAIGGGLLFGLLACASGGLWLLLMRNDRHPPEPQQAAALQRHEEHRQGEPNDEEWQPPEEKKPEDKKPEEKKPDDKKFVEVKQPKPLPPLKLDQEKAIGLQATALAYDHVRGYLYAAVGSTAAKHANQVLAINPASGEVAWSVNVGANPSLMAISQDAKALWLSAASSLQRIDLATQTAGPLLPLAMGEGKLYAESLQILPGTTDSVAASLCVPGSSPRHAGVVIFDNGVRRPQQTPGHTGANRIACTDEPGILIGYNNETTEFGLRRLRVDGDGIREIQKFGGVIQGFGIDITSAGGRIYSTSGVVVDAKTCAAVGKVPAAGQVCVDPVNKRAYYLVSGKAIEAYDTESLTRRESYASANLSNQPAGPTFLGNSVLAFRTQTNIVLVPLNKLEPPLANELPRIEPIPRGNLLAVPLQANDLAFDARRGHIYAAIANTSAKQGNTITALNPTTGAALWSVTVGSNPCTLALSDDGSTLWVGFRGVPSIQRIDIDKRQAGPLLPLEINRFGPSFAEKLLPVPGKSDAVIVNHVRQGTTSRGLGLVVYDNGVPRPETWQGSGAGAVTLTDDPARLYTFNDESTEFGLRRIELSETGVRQLKLFEGVIRGFRVEITHARGRIYSSVGAVVDTSSGALVGTIPAEGSVCVDGERKRAYYLVVKKSSLEAYDTDSLTKQAELADGAIDKSATRLIRIGAGGLAFCAKSEIILVPDRALRANNEAPEAKATPDNIPLRANALAFDSRRGHLYAAVGSASLRGGNTVCALDPKTGATVWSVNVASDPAALSVSGDGKALWVGFSGASCLQRIDLDKRQVGPSLALPASPHGATFVETMEVLPGTTDTVVASLFSKGVSPRHQGVFVFDNGVRRTKQAPGHTGSNRVVATEDPAELIGYNNESTEFGLRTLKVDADGIHETKKLWNAISGFNADIAYANGRVFSTLGTVNDAKTLASAGRLPVKGGPIAVDPTNKCIHVLAAGKVETFDTVTLKRRSTNACVPASPPTDKSRVVALGADAVAYTTAQNIVIVPLTNRP